MTPNNVQIAIDAEVEKRNKDRGPKEDQYVHEKSGGSGILAAEGEIILGRERLQYGVSHDDNIQSTRYLVGGTKLFDNPNPTDTRPGPSCRLNADTDLAALAEEMVDSLGF